MHYAKLVWALLIEDSIYCLIRCVDAKYPVQIVVREVIGY